MLRPTWQRWWWRRRTRHHHRRAWRADAPRASAERHTPVVDSAHAKATVSQLTYADLQVLPDDHNRYELIDGELLVTASPNTAHQRAVGNLHLLLRAACPPDLEVFLAPYDWLVDDRNVFVPDLLAARRLDLTARNLPRPPVLAVEVLSPTRSRDLGRKRDAYARSGLTHYWVVDPLVPSLRVLELDDGRFREVGAATHHEPVVLHRPFPITVTPARLFA